MTTQTDPERTEALMLRRYGDLTKRPGQRVLEVGCGDGRLTWRYAAAASGVVGIDLQRDDLRIAKADRPANLAERVHFVLADGERLPFMAEGFDLAIFAWSF